jgi:glycosyltransferase involved in cell wall biosynthesis
LLFIGMASGEMMVSENIEFTVLMPCLNEARTLALCIRKAQSFLASEGVRGEVLIADNGSIDGSAEIALAEGARVVHVPERGYGAALMGGIRNARGRFVVMGDADDSYEFSELSGFLAQLRAGSDLVMGNRFRGGIVPGAMPLLHRYVGNPILSFIGRLFFRTPIGDFHCGLRGFSRDAMLRLGLVAPGMEFASEMIAKASLAGLRITEVPTTLRPDGRDRLPHLRTWRDGWRHLRFLMLFCPRWLFLYPGLLLLTAGLLGFALLLHGPVDLVAVGFDIHSLLYMAGAVVLGAQMVQVAVLTKWMGILAGVVPPQRWLMRWGPYLKLETGLLVGFALLVTGLGWSLHLLLDWRLSGYGPLDPRESMRAAIPAVTLMILGVQFATAALFGGALHFCWLSVGRKTQS